MRTASRLPPRPSTAAIQYPGHENDDGSSIGTRPRFRPASHWRQKTFGSSPSGVGSCPASIPSASARQRTNPGSEPIIAPAYASRPTPLPRQGATALDSRDMATFTTRFLGCKVSFADEQAIRERLLADGHTEAPETGDVAVINTCCVTNEAVAKSRQAAAQAARTHGRVVVTGCAANLSADGIRRPARQRARRRPQERGARRCRLCRRRRDRLRPGRSPARAGARLRQDPGRLLVLVLVLRHPARPWRHAQPVGDRRSSTRFGGERRRVTRRSCSPASTSAASAIALPA